MGGCVGAQHDSSGSLNENSEGTGVALGRNQPLKKEKPKWKSDYPMTDGQLRSKRDEFWDTAPAFEGRKEIWDALKAAAHAFENNDHELAQAIIDGANITLPHGALTECYDELGNRYQLPVYCLAPPINMIEEKSDIETLDIPDPPPNSGYECQLRLRLSTGLWLQLSQVCSKPGIQEKFEALISRVIVRHWGMELSIVLLWLTLLQLKNCILFAHLHVTGNFSIP
ncbi:ubiquitin domain-containing protein 2 isoform X2 [Vombatus ursinus]|uniref:Ubiquitin domain containing 2 n=1 Tax=Vombatus ursinus TaxID=29139 RepID=A0A4X2JTN5_VOMUR|nr:ubiquitin domain-containing protein 2 isoform X2 [Vombatus ursinus]